jgi:hypothetical protein
LPSLSTALMLALCSSANRHTALRTDRRKEHLTFWKKMQVCVALVVDGTDVGAMAQHKLHSFDPLVAGRYVQLCRVGDVSGKSE